MYCTQVNTFFWNQSFFLTLTISLKIEKKSLKSAFSATKLRKKQHFITLKVSNCLYSRVTFNLKNHRITISYLNLKILCISYEVHIITLTFFDSKIHLASPSNGYIFPSYTLSPHLPFRIYLTVNYQHVWT